MASIQPIHSPHLRHVSLRHRRPPTTTAIFTTTSYGCRRILTISFRLNASTPSYPECGEDLLSNDPSLSDRGGLFPVFVSLPVDAVGPGSGQVRRRKAMVQSFKALAAAGSKGSSWRFGGGSSRGTCRGFKSGRGIGISRRWRGGAG